MIRKTLTILSLIGLLLSLGLWGVSYIAIIHWRSSDGSTWMRIEPGGVNASKSDFAVDHDVIFFIFGEQQVKGWGIRRVRDQDRILLLVGRLPTFKKWGKIQGSITRSIKMPLWIPALMFGIILCPCCRPLHRHRRRKRKKLGLCLKCGYDLVGLTEPRCPECGTSFEERLLKKDT